MTLSSAFDSPYYSDGQRLFEVASQRVVRNYGRLGGTLTYTVLRDCVTEVEARVDELMLVALSEVRRAA